MDLFLRILSNKSRAKTGLEKKFNILGEKYFSRKKE